MSYIAPISTELAFDWGDQAPYTPPLGTELAFIWLATNFIVTSEINTMYSGASPVIAMVLAGEAIWPTSSGN